MEELIGPKPPDRTWRDEFKGLLLLRCDIEGIANRHFALGKTSEALMQEHLYTVSNGKAGKQVEIMVEQGWERDTAEAVRLLIDYCSSALRDVLAVDAKNFLRLATRLVAP